MKNILKGSVLLLFSTLIIGFVALRSGFFGNSKMAYPSSPNGSSLNNQTDSLYQFDSSEVYEIEMMPSSKMLIINDVDLPQSLFADSIDVKIDSSIKDTTFKVNRMMVGSKFSVMMEPEDLKILQPDSLKTDTLK